MNKIISTENYVVRAEVNSIATPADFFWFMLTSQLLTAKDPEGRQELVRLIMSREQLEKLRSVIDLSLAKAHHVEETV